MPEDEKQPEENVQTSTPDVEETSVPSESQPDDNNVEQEEHQEAQSVPLRALQEERERRQSLQAELEIMKQIAGDQVLFDSNGRPVPRTPIQPQPTQPSNNVTAEMEKLWEEDPRKAVQMEIMSAMSWRDNLESTVDKQELEASQKFKDYGQYRDTVRQYVRALPLDQRAKPGVVDLAYLVVKGQASDNIYQRAQQDLLRKIQAGEKVQGLTQGTVPAPQQSKGTQPSDEQRAVAEMMGLTVEGYMSQLKVAKEAK